LSLPAREPLGSRRFVVCGAGPNGAGVGMWSMHCAVASKVGTCERSHMEERVRFRGFRWKYEGQAETFFTILDVF